MSLDIQIPANIFQTWHTKMLPPKMFTSIAKIKQLQESPLHGEGLTLNAEKIKLNNLLQKLSSQVAAIFK